MRERLDAEHGVVCRRKGERFGYFGWPSVTRIDDKTLMTASSGLRTAHVCPWGKTVLNVSRDEGRTWSEPRIVNDGPLDDRDAGIVHLGGDRLLVSWFTRDTREQFHPEGMMNEERAAWERVFSTWTDELVRRHLGSWVLLSEDRGATWSDRLRAPLMTPHGPILLCSGELLYLGKQYQKTFRSGLIQAARSRDGGRTWEELGTVPLADSTHPVNYHEPHVVELPSGRLIGAIRIQDHWGKDLTAAAIPSPSIMLTGSEDGGRTWTQARPMGFHGVPPHLMRHSSGVLILTYGYRREPYGQRVALSHDGGASWEHDHVLRDDGPDRDLGYPATVELHDGDLFTVYYQRLPGDEKCSLLWSRWRLP